MPIFSTPTANGGHENLTMTQVWGRGRSAPRKVVLASIGLVHLLGNRPLQLNTGFHVDGEFVYRDPLLVNPAGGPVCPLCIVRLEEPNSLESDLLRQVRALRDGTIDVPDNFEPKWEHADNVGGVRHHSLNNNWRFRFDGHARFDGQPTRLDEGGVLLLNPGETHAHLGIVVDFDEDGRGFYVTLASALANSETFRPEFEARFR